MKQIYRTALRSKEVATFRLFNLRMCGCSTKSWGRIFQHWQRQSRTWCCVNQGHDAAFKTTL